MDGVGEGDADPLDSEACVVLDSEVCIPLVVLADAVAPRIFPTLLHQPILSAAFVEKVSDVSVAAKLIQADQSPSKTSGIQVWLE